ncbi:NrsF family protein [Neotabrizicola shimadae]|uniref:DUF1109 domain-containing protein n=1 Tax=Neotabrizicola shimadae TaxID=2807096 RepID=A0A8G0ZR37_9RHOB|nr:DUF1109 domain-containing protein [Neotabrizicola shimadae]QYZ68869.1 DUF1109 domain-containing protein [Neotabrizicola shimadae]
MKTEDLITLLAADPPPPAFSALRVAAVLLAAVGLCAGLFLALAGPRPDLAAALAVPVVLAKTLLAALTCTLSLWLVLRLARPGHGLGRAGLVLVLPALLAGALWLQGYAARPPEVRFADVTPLAVAECLGFIVLLSAIPAAVALRLLRDGASTSPALSGALAGLAASAGAATGYSLFCTQDNPVFYITWYGLALFIVTAACAMLGRRRLDW